MKEFDPALNSSSDPEQDEHFASSLELKELATVFAEQRADRFTALDIIEHALMEPIPDFDDSEAVAEYNAKMEWLKKIAVASEERADELDQLWERIEAHIVKRQQPEA